MKFLAIISLAFSSAVAFVPGTLAPAHSARIIRMSDEALSEVEAPIEDEEIVPVPEGPTYTCVSKSSIMAEPNTLEFGGVWDPLGLADIGSDETLAWYRHAEVKHGRVAMAAFVGWWAVGAGLRLPGELSHGLDFASIPSKGIGAWDATPGWGKAQMLLFAGLIEFHDELFHSRRSENGHYLRGGTPGKNMCPGVYDPIGLSARRSEEDLARGRSAEIKNGRLAMIGIAGMWFAATVPGSVPFQPDC